MLSAEGSMRAIILLAIGVAATVAIGLGPAAASGRENPHGFGLYSPDPRHGAYRYDPRSWYYRRPGYYPFYGSRYWVPRSAMRYRYRYLYYGPKYRYYPSWGYPLPGCCEGGDSHWHWNW
jgi:hypothetical protein